MTRYLRFVLPVVVVLLTLVGVLVHYFSGNDAALTANITALCGWLVIATDEFITFKNSSK